MNNLAKRLFLGFLLTLPVITVSAQSSSHLDGAAETITTIVAAPAENLFALYSNETTAKNLFSVVPAVSPTATVQEQTATKTMSEELSAWVENKQAVIKSGKNSNRYK